MQQQERDLISGLFDRLKPFESQPRDGEAESFIRGLAAQQPAAPYLLVQTVLVQEQALKAAQARIAELEEKALAAPPAATGFLGSAPRIGPWGAPAAGDAPRTSVPSTVPSTRSPLQAALAPQQPPQQPAGGSFLRTAMATAAGVAGGALLFEGIRGLMGSNPFGQQQAAMGGSTPPELLPPDSSTQQQAFADDQAGAGDYDTAAVDDGGFGGDDESWA
ncbi:DUF2076 domain-containing protein [Reyranella sp.]|jgi:hypothetical protein|uniref:DUF2076 domain-containing protein n=1 Tax=Reyranella sp. TaxID=1929291 RepID=UPI000BDA485D|nr:DUF2076 domain-containing protein [Reyranella sp.]OYY46079.1 MAG: hypothetical protein B7Y57_04290 [Rhodospirillales bacterium 35-66-84]OYZ96459.1 MAG: hypothetical protein B7Y08_04650 [Rhodospirillales bacterium 24-66-33]OZB28378.1 MAG: hypothetical protein B7X63_00495 [Rhodospirillales bacterium 39-66-50]HQS14416.1 DUF2076 domain-containing protein [Reyranella sp.]HQT11413.1 DUF2076 domain-containing protein [Reyranella sp.]